jgi:hypothetical protein
MTLLRRRLTNVIIFAAKRDTAPCGGQLLITFVSSGPCHGG